MKAKDTVMNVDEMGQAIIKHSELPMGQAIAKEQAEISFKAGEMEEARNVIDSGLTYNDGKEAGRKAGIREVVELVHLEGTVSRDRKSLSISYSAWLAKLKEWGL